MAKNGGIESGDILVPAPLTWTVMFISALTARRIQPERKKRESSRVAGKVVCLKGWLIYGDSHFYSVRVHSQTDTGNNTVASRAEHWLQDQALCASISSFMCIKIKHGVPDQGISIKIKYLQDQGMGIKIKYGLQDQGMGIKIKLGCKIKL